MNRINTRLLTVLIFWLEFLLFNIMFISILPIDLSIMVSVWFILVTMGSIYFILKGEMNA